MSGKALEYERDALTKAPENNKRIHRGGNKKNGKGEGF